MDIEIIELCKHRIEKAKGDLRTAKNNYDNGEYNQSVNRAYYSIFHSMRAILAFDKYDSKKHSGIIAFFNQNYVKPGIFDKRYSKIIKEAESIRNESDYKDFYVVEDFEAKEQIENAEEFLEVSEQYILTRIAKDQETIPH